MASTKRIQLTSGALHVESNGDPLGRLVLCVHGLSANCRSFDRFVPVLAEAGHHVVTMDLRGRGRSDITPPGSYGWDSHVRDLLEIAELYGADSFDVIGHSMGGFIGMSLAAQYPRRCGRLVLIDAVGAPEPSALLSIAKSVSRLGRTYPSASAALSHMRAAGTIAPWDAFWDGYFGWELESCRRHRPGSHRRGCGARGQRVRINAERLWALAAVGMPGPVGPGQQAHGLRRRPGGLAV